MNMEVLSKSKCLCFFMSLLQHDISSFSDMFLSRPHLFKMKTCCLYILHIQWVFKFTLARNNRGLYALPWPCTPNPQRDTPFSCTQVISLIHEHVFDQTCTTNMLAAWRQNTNSKMGMMHLVSRCRVCRQPVFILFKLHCAGYRIMS